ncbi:DHH phosphoesterase [Xylariomycetidae sp. FL2044]|nr:DHH phosphoesterase [Xylariomycetidae sp. FL2044]
MKLYGRMAHPKSLQAFLTTARAALTSPPSRRPNPLTFVLGNESADLDSLCSALLLAYLRTSAPPHTLHIPLCHLRREDLTLRPEFGAVLRHASASLDDVLTLDELPLPLPLPPGDDDHAPPLFTLGPEATRWLLVDHNVMTGDLGRVYGDRVVGCVDHHADEGRVPRHPRREEEGEGEEEGEDVPRVIEKSGSCASLVVEHCRDAWDAVSREISTKTETETETAGESQTQTQTQTQIQTNTVDQQLAYLALGPILIDTNNLSDKNKTTAHDTAAVALAESKMMMMMTRTSAPVAVTTSSTSSSSDKKPPPPPVPAYERKAFFDRLSALKQDLSAMSVRDVLRKDYKEWTGITEGEAGLMRLGISSVPRSVAYLVDKAGGEGVDALVRELEMWSREKGVDVVAVMTGYTTNNDDNDDENKDGGGGGGAFRRELLVWGRKGGASGAGAGAVRAARAFAEANREDLRLETWGRGEFDVGDDDDDDDDDGEGGEEEEEEGEQGTEGWRRCWTQGATAFSRKQIAPLLRDALRESGKA